MPTYNRPIEVSLPKEYDFVTDVYTRMSIYYDLHIYDKDRDDTLLYRYLYLIIYMLCCKAKYFKDQSFRQHDEFSHYMAQKVYLRYINPKHQGDDKIVSVLNYCKALLNPTRIDFQRDTYAEIIGSNPKDDSSIGVSLENDFKESIQRDYLKDSSYYEAVVEKFKEFPKCIRESVNETPYKSDPVMSHRLYMSTLLTIINSITFDNNTLLKLKKREEKGLDNDELIKSLLAKARLSSVILWRLDETYSNLVQLLATKSRKKCSSLMGLTRAEFELDDEDVSSILMSAYGNIARDDNEEF